MSRAETKILLCTDLDRTLIPNGQLPVSPGSDEMLHGLASHPDITLAYVSGRNKALLQEAIREYDLPLPHYAIGDVGTTIYETHDNQWQAWHAWSEEIAPDWRGQTPTEIAQLLTDLLILEPQEVEKQNQFKLSYYTPINIDRDRLFDNIYQRLDQIGIRANLIWSVDEAAQVGLLDLLPKSADKLHAIHFLMQKKGFRNHETLFAGDSGNDLPVLCSDIRSILVANAPDEVKQEAFEQTRNQGIETSLFIATGRKGLGNGNYRIKTC